MSNKVSTTDGRENTHQVCVDQKNETKPTNTEKQDKTKYPVIAMLLFS